MDVTNLLKQKNLKGRNGKNVEVGEEEYNEAPENLKKPESILSELSTEISVNRKKFFNDMNQYLKYSYYVNVNRIESQRYYKYTIQSYSIEYLKILILDDVIELNYSGGTIRVKPISYEISYFND